MQRTKNVNRTSVGGRTTIKKAVHWRDELACDFFRGKVGARRWVRHSEKNALRSGRYEF